MDKMCPEGFQNRNRNRRVRPSVCPICRACPPLFSAFRALHSTKRCYTVVDPFDHINSLSQHPAFLGARSALTVAAINDRAPKVTWLTLEIHVGQVTKHQLLLRGTRELTIVVTCHMMHPVNLNISAWYPVTARYWHSSCLLLCVCYEYKAFIQRSG